MQNWGGPLVIHELIQYPDGRIGTKWMEEITPATEPATQLTAELSQTNTFETPGNSFLLTFEVYPEQAEQGRLAVSFLPEKGDKEACEWQLQLNKARSQFGNASTDGYALDEKTLKEGGAPQAAGNYAIEGGIDTSKHFIVRMLVNGCNKFGGSLIDAEIGGQRTLITYRPNLTVDKLQFRMNGVTIKNIQIAPLRN